MTLMELKKLYFKCNQDIKAMLLFCLVYKLELFINQQAADFIIHTWYLFYVFPNE